MWTVFYSTMGTSACSIITGRDTEGPEHSGDRLVHGHYLNSEYTKYEVVNFSHLSLQTFYMQTTLHCQFRLYHTKHFNNYS